MRLFEAVSTDALLEPLSELRSSGVTHLDLQAPAAGKGRAAGECGAAPFTRHGRSPTRRDHCQ